MAHFAITLENRDGLREALDNATNILKCLTSTESDWIQVGLQLADYLEAVEDYTGDGDQLVLNTAPVSNFAPLPPSFEPPCNSYAFCGAMVSTCKGLEQFIALCPECGWGSFLNAVRTTLSNARAAV